MDSTNRSRNEAYGRHSQDRPQSAARSQQTSARSQQRAHTQRQTQAHAASQARTQRERSDAYAGYTPATAHSRYNPEATRTHGKPKKKRSFIPIIIVIVVLVVAGAFIYNTFFRHFNVTVNGQEVGVEQGNTIETLLDEGYAVPIPGNLLAIDGSVITQGGGKRCTATIDSEPAELDTPLTRNAIVTIGDGTDVTEEETVTEEAIPAGRSDDNASFEAYWFGSIHLLSDGKDGTRRVRTGNESGVRIEEVVTPAIDAGYHIYTARPSDKVIALTFDDGPWGSEGEETTAAILDILEQYNAKATFFTIGYQVDEWPDPVKRADSLGCEVLTHSWDHAAAGDGVDLTLMSSDAQIEEVQKGYEAIQRALGKEPAHIMRAPGGNFHGSIIDTLWPYVDAEIGWNIDTRDWAQPGTDSIVSAILSSQPGDVVLMHDGGGNRWQTVEALRIALPQLIDQGYSFVTVSELLAYGMPVEEPAE